MRVRAARERRGVALALVLAALVLAGSLAAGAVMAAGQAMRDASGTVVRSAALAAAEGALARAVTAAEWDTAWSAPGPAGPVALRAHLSAAAADTVRVVRLDPATFLLLAEARAGAAGTLQARARLSILVVLDGSPYPVRAPRHAWSTMP
jgi:hypothetical protein